MKLFFNKTGSGPTLVILHGLFGSSDNWATLGRKFAENFTVYLVDLRNHGRSPHNASNSFLDMVQDLHELIIDENLNNINLIGHSMGGKVAMRFAMQYPEKVNTLISVDAAPVNYPATLHNYHLRYIEALELIDLSLCHSRGEAERLLTKAILSDRMVHFFAKNIYWKEKDLLDWRFNLSSLKKYINEIFEGFDLLSDGIKPANVKSLFIKGELSDYIIDDYSKTIYNLFPQATIAIIPGASHWVHADKPELFYDAVMSFLLNSKC